MRNFLEKETNLIKEFNMNSSIDGSKITYWQFKINDLDYMLSYNSRSMSYYLTNFYPETEEIDETIGFGSGNKIKELIKRLKLTRFKE